MQKLRKRSHYFQEIHHPGHGWFVADVFQFTGDETRSNIHIDFWIYSGSCIFVNTNLFDSAFTKIRATKCYDAFAFKLCDNEELA